MCRYESNDKDFQIHFLISYESNKADFHGSEKGLITKLFTLI